MPALPATTNRGLHVALSHDLNMTGAKVKVVNDAIRKIFTANANGAVLEFRHSQPDSDFWNGVKYYGSGKRSRIRIVRTPPADAK
jgi:hypothetical protein